MSYAYGSEHGGTAYHENRYEDAPEQHQEIDNRPKDLTDQQDKVIQLVAKYVVYSEDGARYQSKLLSKTRHNPYFAFLTSPDHKYYNYYQYLLQSYSLWKNLAASMEGSSYHQQGEADESAWDYGTQYAQAAGETADNGQEKGIAGAGGAGNAGAQERATVPLSNSGGGAVPNANSEGDRGNGSPSGHIAAPGEADDDDDDQPQFQIIMENGVAKAVPEHHCKIESKTKDNVFVHVKLVLQYQVLPDKVEKAFYTLSSPIEQIEAYVFNSIRGKIPLYRLEALFLERSTIAAQLKEEVDERMDMYGYDIVGALITEIDPGAAITTAMNDVQKYQRLRVAAVDEAETNKLKRVRAAEAACEAKRLSGEGLAEQRKAIVAGLQQSIEDFKNDVPGASLQDAMSLLLMNQYFDTLKDVSARSTSGSLLFLDTTGGIDAMANQLKSGVLMNMK